MGLGTLTVPVFRMAVKLASSPSNILLACRKSDGEGRRGAGLCAVAPPPAPQADAAAPRLHTLRHGRKLRANPRRRALSAARSHAATDHSAQEGRTLGQSCSPAQRRDHRPVPPAQAAPLHVPGAGQHRPVRQLLPGPGNRSSPPPCPSPGLRALSLRAGLSAHTPERHSRKAKPTMEHPRLATLLASHVAAPRLRPRTLPGTDRRTPSPAPGLQPPAAPPPRPPPSFCPGRLAPALSPPVSLPTGTPAARCLSALPSAEAVQQPSALPPRCARLAGRAP